MMYELFFNDDYNIKRMTPTAIGPDNGGDIQIVLDSENGTLVGTCNVALTSSNTAWQTVRPTLAGGTGVHNVYLKFVGPSSGFLFNFNWWQCTSTSGGQSPYTELTAIPRIIELENYDTCSEAIGYHDSNLTSGVIGKECFDKNTMIFDGFTLTQASPSNWNTLSSANKIRRSINSRDTCFKSKCVSKRV